MTVAASKLYIQLIELSGVQEYHGYCYGRSD
jgi:hypothetical protein